MIIKIFSILILFTLFSHPSFPQTDSLSKDIGKSFIIDSIIVQGNEITETEIILRELTFIPTDSITQKVLDYNKERIFSLGLFTKVDLFIYPFNGKNILVISVEESWYIYPIPVMNLRDNDWNKLSYGLYLVVKNFRGRNETLIGRAELGYDPTYRLSYYKPSITFGSDIFFGAELIYRTSANKSQTAAQLFGGDFDQKFIVGSVELGKRFGLFHRTNIRLNYIYVETPKFIRGVNASDSRVDRYPSIGFGYSYDTRDLIQFPKEGIYGAAYLELKGLGINDINYQVFGFDFREYRNIFADLTAKWRFASRFTSGKLIPYYDYSFIGFNDRIRGNYNLEQEGNNSYIGSVEFFYPIIKDVNVSFDFIPILPHELLSYRIALYLQLFGDAGTTNFSGKPVSLKDFRSGYGIGLSLLVLPYNILRFELAFDEYQNSQFIFGLGLSF